MQREVGHKMSTQTEEISLGAYRPKFRRNVARRAVVLILNRYSGNLQGKEDKGGYASNNLS
jgi:hypothetical protein